MAKNRLSGYPEEFWREVGLMRPEQKTPEDVEEAYKIIADFPTTFGMIEETYTAFTNVREDERLDPEQRARMISRYGPHMEAMFTAAKTLGELMSEDFMLGEGEQEQDA